MKPFFVAVSIFISSLINILNAQTCTVASFPTLPTSYDCGSYDVLKPVNLPNFPASGTLMMTVAFTVKSLAFCDDSVVNPTFFSISVKSGGVDKRILHFTQSSSDKNFYIFVTDTVGTPYIVAQQLVNDGTWVRLAVSIQLASTTGKVAQRGLSNQQYTTNSKINLQFSNWKFDSTTQLSISSDIGGLNPVNFSFRDLVVEYTYTDTTLNAYLFGANRPTPIASYFGTAGSTSAYTFKDLIGYIGTGYVGASTPTFNDDTYSPAWSSVIPNTPSFQYEYQYARIPSDLMIQPWDELTLFSMTINFKIQVTKTPVYSAVTYPIFKRSKSTGTTLMSISLKYTRVLTVTYGSLSVDSSTLAVNTTYDVTVFFATLTGIGGTTKTGVIIIYFGTAMQGTESAPATLTALYSEATTDTVYIGRGAVANISSFKIYSPGTAQINKPCAFCAPSTYTSGSSCLPCDTSCKTCSGADSASCLSCQLDKYLSGTTCLPCDFSCQSCTGPNPNQCSSCYHGYYLSGTSCLPCASTCATCVTSGTTCTSCLNGKYLSGTSCLLCHISCATCAAGVSTACLTCPATDYYSSGSSCPACHTSCRTCISNTDYNCSSCYTTRYLMTRAPPDVINAGTYCVLCTSPCATCTAEGVHNCLTCISGKYLNGTRCQTCQDSTNCVCHANCDTCIGPTQSECLTCPAGRYFVKNITGTYCLPCVSPCANCITTSTTCTSCITSKYLFGSICKCDANCQNCDGPTSNDCTSCFDGKYLSGKTCVACQSPCVNCLTATQCTSCITNRFLVGTDCVGCTSPCVTCTGIPTNCTSCIAGKYVSANLCTDCNTPCLTCTGAGTYNCSSCGTGLALYAVAGQGNTCLACHTTCLTCNGITDSQCTSCPSGRYSVIIGVASYCYACTSPCATCTGLDTSCTSCIDGTYLDNNKCFTCTSPCQTCTWSGTSSCTSCIPGTYLSGTTCKPCNYPCQTCSGPGSNACLSCVSESYLSGTSCPLCDLTCQTCSGPGPNSCTSCAGGKILSGTACLPCSPLCARCSGLQADECTSCVTGAYMAGPGTTCISCTSPCKTCTGSTVNECASCEDGTYLVGSLCGTCDPQCRTCSGPGPNACISCPQGTNLAGTSCVYCDPACQTCNGPNANQCLTCVAGKYLSGTSCMLCNLPCVTCTGPTANDCTLCAPGTYLSGTTCQPCTDPCATCTGAGPNSCISCIAGTYQSGTTCYTCASPCKTCSGPGINACISCITGKYLDSSSSQCQDCDPSCNECTGPSANECKSCPPGSYLVGSSCVVCDISCLTCTGDAANQCTSCYAGKYLNGNTCVGCTPPCARCTGPATNQCKSCTDGAYLTGTTCSLCTPPCKSCTGPQTNSCTSCIKGTFLVGTTCQECTSPCSSCTGPGPNACSSCPTSHYLSNSLCLPCHKSCLECTGPEAGACTSCFDGVYLFGGFCVTLSPEEEKAVASAAAIGTTMTQALTGGLVIASIASSGDPSGIASGTLVRMLEYIRYINISYPPKLEALFMKTATASDSSPFSITPNMPANIETNLGSDPPPQVFSKYQVPSSFLMNYWGTFISSCIILGIVICLKVLRMILGRITKKHNILHTILKRVLIFTQNYLLIQFYESIGDVILFSSLELRAVHFKSWGVISLLVSLLCLMVGTAIFVWHFRLIKSYQHIKKQAADHTASDELGQFEKNYEGVQVLYDEFKDTSFNHQAFLLFFASRDLAFSLTLSVLIDYPLAQISTITGLNIMMFAYLISKRPLKSRINALQHIVCEVILLTVNSIVIIIAVLSISGAEYKAELDYLGQVVIICSVVLYVVSFFFLVPRTLRELRDLFKYLKNFFKKFFQRGRQTVLPNEIKREGKVIEENDETIARAKRDMSLDNRKEISYNHSDSIVRPREEDSSVAKINLDISQIDDVHETLPQVDDYSTRQFALDITPQASQKDQGRWFLDSKNAQTLDMTNVNLIEEGIKQPVVDEKILEEEDPNLEDITPENGNNQEDDINIAEIDDEMGGTVKLRRKIELSGEVNSSQMIIPKTVTLTPVRLDFSDLVQEASLEERITRLSGFTPGEKKIGGDLGDTAETKVRRRK